MFQDGGRAAQSFPELRRPRPFFCSLLPICVDGGPENCLSPCVPEIILKLVPGIAILLGNLTRFSFETGAGFLASSFRRRLRSPVLDTAS